MNYWHLQMHPGDRAKFQKGKIIQILQEKKVIGMGESWENQQNEEVPAPTTFKNNMQVDDVVMVRSGIAPIALVQVIGSWFIENSINDGLDWFKLRRPIKLLGYYSETIQKLKEAILQEYGKSHIQAPGTLTPANNDNATNQFIKKWYLQVQKEKIMENIKLTPNRIASIKKLWSNYISNYSNKDIEIISKKISVLQEDWQYYKNKIINGTLSLEDYTNRIEFSELKGGYLCNFLERTTREIYGSSRPGNSIYFEIKLNADGRTYTFRETLSNREKENFNTKEAAEERFEASVKNVLHNIVSKTEALDKVEAVENANYTAKQILRKMAVLDMPDDFLNMYADDAVNTLHNEFLNSETNTNLGKSHEIRIVINHILDIEKTPVNGYLVSRFLWKYVTSSAVADQNSPNVILYGPPGTGKTYTVKQSLDFVCMGEKTERCEFVTFHPSFTYEDFIDGIKPKGVTKDGNIKFELTDGVFKKFCKKALAECIKAKEEKREPKPYYFVVDEINRANLSAVFGETLMCLEKDYRYDVNKPNDNLYKTQYSPLIESMIIEAKKENQDISDLAFIYHKNNSFFGVPNNLYFIGMMNDVDKSIDAFDLALRRRFKWERMDYSQEVLEQETKFRNGKDFFNISQYANACTKLNEYISETLGLGKSYEFGHSFFMKIKTIATTRTISKNNIDNLFSLYLEPSLKEYLRALFSEQELNYKVKEALQLFKNNLA